MRRKKSDAHDKKSAEATGRNEEEHKTMRMVDEEAERGAIDPCFGMRGYIARSLHQGAGWPHMCRMIFGDCMCVDMPSSTFVIYSFPD